MSMRSSSPGTLGGEAAKNIFAKEKLNASIAKVAKMIANRPAAGMYLSGPAKPISNVRAKFLAETTSAIPSTAAITTPVFGMGPLSSRLAEDPTGFRRKLMEMGGKGRRRISRRRRRISRRR